MSELVFSWVQWVWQGRRGEGRANGSEGLKFDVEDGERGEIYC